MSKKLCKSCHTTDILLNALLNVEKQKAIGMSIIPIHVRLYLSHYLHGKYRKRQKLSEKNFTVGCQTFPLYSNLFLQNYSGKM